MTDLRTPITFQVEYHSKPGKTEFGVTADLASRPEIEEPYTGMFNVKLVQLVISAIIEEGKASKYEIFGKVSLGDYKTVEDMLTGRILFEGTTPHAVLVEYENTADGSISVTQLYDKIITPKNTNTDVFWPKDYPNFKFISAYIGYVRASGDFSYSGKSLKAGYHLGASVYLFGESFGLSLNIGDFKDGIEFKATYNTDIDAEFAVIKGFNAANAEKRAEGPAILVSSKKGKGTTFKLEAGISFFQTDPINFSLAYEVQQNCFTGQVQFEADFGRVSKPKVDFTYKDSRFSFQGWDVEDQLDGITDVTRLLEKDGKRKRDCGELVNLFFKDFLSMKFKFLLSLPEDDPNAGKSSASQPDPNTKEGILGKYKSIINRNDKKIHVSVKG